MVLLATSLLGLLLGFRAGASPAVWNHQYDDRSPSTARRETQSRNCTADSFTNVTDFILREYLVETVVSADNTTHLRGTLAVENPGTGDTYRLYHIPISLGGGVWSICFPGDDAPLPPQLARCQYLIEKFDNRIGFRFDWYCDGKNPDSPVLFDATVIGDLPAEVCVAQNGTNGVTQACRLPGDVLLSVENISWEDTSESGQMD
ncbi:hypothetical protein B0T26DRAFT_757518 [Lasiosphaeria miniovina]|uniref:AA1-like domain-containing protein n=1 Tax=Lasiosphaeria miniovina TaxID=1954250 RepID=A0AA39ZV03_9PEZI|nr:uncharacterized protein B0T26DRAFT_757518 [Lasiosphaeria miniovina]KAK0704025.1 hypothetical protein B0T26DRAFT_757518 [Lasiosphaeria miniovina]